MVPSPTPAVFDPKDEALIPRPHYLPGYSNAIEWFCNVPYGAQLIVRVFAVILEQHETGDECFLCEETNNRSESLIDAIPELVDSEAPQLQTRQRVIDYLLKIPPGVCEEVDEYIDQTDLSSGDIVWEKDEGYTIVTRGVKWLVECALLRLQDGVAYQAETRTALQQLLIPQPKYDSIRDYSEAVYLGTVTTALEPALHLFTIWPRCDETSIASLVEIVMDIALIVAAIWDTQPRYQPPSYVAYVGGFVQARAHFRNAVEATPSLCANNTLGLPYHTRAALKEINLMDLWFTLWVEAANLDYYEHGPTLDCMYETIVNLFAEIPWRWNSQDLDMKALLRRMWREGQLGFQTPKEMSRRLPLRLAGEIRKGVFGGITQNMAHAQNIGCNLYPPEDIRAFWTAKSDHPEVPPNEVLSGGNQSSMHVNDGPDTMDHSDDEGLSDEMLRDCCDEPYLEAYGTYIQPLEHGTWDLDIPQDQRCVVCLEEHGLVGVKMNTCGHYFHLACIKEWTNGTSPNANLCPECRAQICQKRRKVRLAPWMYDESDESDIADEGDDGAMSE